MQADKGRWFYALVSIIQFNALVEKKIYSILFPNKFHKLSAWSIDVLTLALSNKTIKQILIPTCPPRSNCNTMRIEEFWSGVNMSSTHCGWSWWAHLSNEFTTGLAIPSCTTQFSYFSAVQGAYCFSELVGTNFD
jgi:hypothetical protein